MHFTTPKQQLKEYERTLREERSAIVKDVLITIFKYASFGLITIALIIAMAFFWVKN